MTDQVKAFDRAWTSLQGMWYRQDKGKNTGRNAEATLGTIRMRWSDLRAAYMALDMPPVEFASRYGYAERRMKLGREDAESFKAICQGRGEW